MELSTSSISNEIDKSIKEDFSVSQAAIDEIKLRKERGEKPESLSNEEIKKNDSVLDIYRVLDDAIHGGMGSVWRVHHESWNTDLAMKRPQPHFFAEGSEARKEEFIKECENWINLGLHPNIVSCYYVREIGGVPTIFSEWMDNGSLKDRIKDGSLYEGTEEEVQERILDIAIQTARGLQYSHENNLIHQDVKPGNILLTKNWDAKVADFGLAKAQSQLTENKKPVSTGYTIQYCPREQAEGAPAEKWMDVYAWALTVLEMYAGKRLWETGAEVVEILKKCLSDCYCTISQVMINILRDAIEKKEDDFSAVISSLLEIYNTVAGEEYPRSESDAAADTADSLNNRALSFLDLGKTEEGFALLNQAVEKNTSHTNSVFNRALALWRAGKINREQAEKLLVSLKDEEMRNTCLEALQFEVTGYVEFTEDFFEDRIEADSAYSGEEKEKQFELRFIERPLADKNLLKIAQIISLKDEKAVRELDVFGGPLESNGRFLAFTPDFGREGPCIETSDHKVCYENGKLVFKPDPTPKKPRITASLETACLSNDGTYIGIGIKYSGYNCKINSKDDYYTVKFFKVATGELLSCVANCFLIGFTWDNKVLLYDQERYLHFSGTSEIPLPDNDPILHMKWSPSSFQQLSKRIGLLKISYCAYCIVDLQSGTLLFEANEELNIYDDIRHHYKDVFRLSDDGCWFLWLHVSSETDIIETQVWDASTGQYMEQSRIERKGVRDNYTYLLSHKRGLHYIPNRADYRISIIEKTEKRLSAQNKFYMLLRQAKYKEESRDYLQALLFIDDAMKIYGFETSPEALKCRARIGAALEKNAAKRIVPVDKVAPEAEFVASEISDEGEDLAEDIRREILPRWKDDDPYSNWSIYTKIGQKSANNRYRLIHYVIIEYRNSPAQYDPEVTHWHGCAVIDRSKQTLIWQKDFLYMHKAPSYNDGAVPDFFTELYRTDINTNGTKLLIRGDGVNIMDINNNTIKKIISGEFIFACFIDNDRFVLCQSANKEVWIINIENDRKCSYQFPVNEYGIIRCIDDNCFAIQHRGTERLCWIVWDYGEMCDDVVLPENPDESAIENYEERDVSFLRAEREDLL